MLCFVPSKETAKDHDEAPSPVTFCTPKEVCEGGNESRQRHEKHLDLKVVLTCSED